MKLGVSLGYSGAVLDISVEFVQRAEALGYDSVWTAEAYGSDAVTRLSRWQDPTPTCVSEARTSIGRYLDFYNGRRPHSALDRRTPDQAYFNPLPLRMAAYPGRGSTYRRGKSVQTTGATSQ